MKNLISQDAPAAAAPSVLTFPGVDMSDCKLALEKEYRYYGTQYDCWVNPKHTRQSILAGMKKGDLITFREVPYQNGVMLLCMDYKSGLDFGVVVNNIAYKLRLDYYGCYLVGEFLTKSKNNIIIRAYQPPEGLNL